MYFTFTDVWRQITEENFWFVRVCCKQDKIYGANVVIFEGIMAFVNEEVRQVSLLPSYCSTAVSASFILTQLNSLDVIVH